MKNGEEKSAIRGVLILVAAIMALTLSSPTFARGGGTIPLMIKSVETSSVGAASKVVETKVSKTAEPEFFFAQKKTGKTTQKAKKLMKKISKKLKIK